MTARRPGDVRWVYLVLEEHPYGREMLEQLLGAGFVPSLIIEERSRISEEEREKFLVRIHGHPVPPTFTALLEGRDGVRRVTVPHHNRSECESLLRALDPAPELIVLGGTRILRRRIFERATVGTLNSHPGLLPEVRGSASVAWAIHFDMPVGCTVHFLDAGVDTGPIVARRTIPVRRADTYESLCRATMTLSGALMVEALQRHVAGTLAGESQPAGEPAHRNMPDDMVAAVKRKLASGAYAHLVD